MTGSGKTGFGIKYLLNADGIACRFIFDDLGQMSARLKIPHAATANELENAIASRWVIYNPHRMFPGDVKRAFRFFCDWTFKVSRRGRGRKIIFADEIWRFQDREEIPPELATVSQMGRVENLELVTATQRPQKLNDSILGSATELVCFRLTESVHLRKIESMGADASAVSRLPLGQYISYDLIKGGQFSGRIF